MDKKLNDLKHWFQEKGQVIIAFSGGVDSSLLLKVGYDVLGDQVIPITANSVLNTPEEIEIAKKVAKEVGIKNHIIIEFNDLDNPLVKANPHDRCYHCKKARFQGILALANEKDIKYVLDGSNIDDLDDYRPGLKAVEELGVLSPLQETGFTKEDIRKLAKALDLSVWDKPSEPCLATRIPTGTALSKEKLMRIYKAEEFLKNNIGLSQVRVRDHGNLARIEVVEEELLRVLEKRADINRALKDRGFTYCTLDLLGYRTGSMNLVGGE